MWQRKGSRKNKEQTIFPGIIIDHLMSFDFGLILKCLLIYEFYVKICKTIV